MVKDDVSDGPHSYKIEGLYEMRQTWRTLLTISFESSALAHLIVVVSVFDKKRIFDTG